MKLGQAEPQSTWQERRQKAQDAKGAKTRADKEVVSGRKKVDAKPASAADMLALSVRLNDQLCDESLFPGGSAGEWFKMCAPRAPPSRFAPLSPPQPRVPPPPSSSPLPASTFGQWPRSAAGSSHFDRPGRGGGTELDAPIVRRFTAVDEDSSGMITYDEFESYLRKDLKLNLGKLSEDELDAAYAALDRDGSGFIATDEFGRFMQSGAPEKGETWQERRQKQKDAEGAAVRAQLAELKYQ